MAVVFKGITRHGRLEFPPGVSLAFKTPNAEKYFVAAGFAEKTSDEPVRTYTTDEVEIDPETVHASSGAKVLGA